MIAEAPTVAHRLIATAFARALRPRARLSVSEWADAHRVLSVVGSAEPGRWKTSRTPYLREIMDCLSEHHPARKVVFRKSSQVGGTEVGSNWIGYIMAHAKGPVAVVMPTDRSLTDWMSQKFDPMAAETPAVAEVLANRNNRSADNNAQRKKFAGGILYTKTAGSTSDLKSTSLRYAIADEVDEYTWDTGQGDPLGLLDVRLTTYHDSKLFIVSSPTVRDASVIDVEFAGGDQRYYHVPCPHCGHHQPLQWGNLRWHHVSGQREDVKEAWYVCAECGTEIAETHKTTMLARGAWVAANPGAPYPSFHINALYSPTGLGKSWPELATQWVRSQDDPRSLQLFINTRLGEAWADRSRDLKANALLARAEPHQLRTVPPGVLCITAGVDTQDDRLEVALWGHAWDADLATRIRWPVDYHVIPGRPSGDEVWAALADYLGARFELPNGRSLPIEATAIDIGGHHTHAVYAFVRSRRVPRCIAVKGAATPGKQILGKPSMQDVNWKGITQKKGVALYLVGTDTAKHLLYGLLEADAERPAHECRVRFSADLGEKWFDGLVSEVFNPRKNRWEIKKGKRNEPLDTFVYAEAASHHPELYLHKWRPIDWKRRARLLGLDEASARAAAPADVSVAGAEAGHDPDAKRRNHLPQDDSRGPKPSAAQSPRPVKGRPARRGRIGGWRG